MPSCIIKGKEGWAFENLQSYIDRGRAFFFFVPSKISSSVKTDLPLHIFFLSFAVAFYFFYRQFLKLFFFFFFWWFNPIFFRNFADSQKIKWKHSRNRIYSFMFVGCITIKLREVFFAIQCTLRAEHRCESKNILHALYPITNLIFLRFW